MWTEPAREAATVDGGACRRPGPSLIGMEELGESGSASNEMLSPGRTKVIMIIKERKAWKDREKSIITSRANQKNLPGA